MADLYYKVHLAFVKKKEKKKKKKKIKKKNIFKK